MNQLVTVFGASGFVGRHVVHALARAGWRVRAVSRRPNLANYLLPSGMTGQIQIFRGDIRDDGATEQALNGADAAVNLVGVLFSRGASNFETLHIDAAGAIAGAAKAAGIRSLVHMSAIGADPMAKARYAQSKGEGERRVREAFPEATVLRPSLIFGPEDSFFNTFAWMARYAPVLPAIGGGTRFQPVYVGDVAAATVAALAHEAARGRTFELGGPDVLTFRELLRIVLDVSGRNRLLLPVPFALAKILAFFLQIPGYVLPMTPLLSVDSVRMLQSDNVVGTADAATFADLKIHPRTVREIVPTYLWRFRREGQFSRPPVADGV